MPAMIRKKGKAKNIAQDILGTPDNIRFSKSPYSKKKKDLISYEETRRLR